MVFAHHKNKVVIMTRLLNLTVMLGILLSFFTISFADVCGCSGYYAQLENKIVKRLQLTEAQHAEIKKIMAKAREDRSLLMARLHEPTKTEESLQEVRAELDKLKDSVRADVAKVLDSTQMQEFDKAVNELRDKVGMSSKGKQ